MQENCPNSTNKTNSENVADGFSLKDWLRDNKIFFEAIAATLLSAMAIIVSVVQFEQAQEQSKIANKHANAQNEILEKQATLLELQTKIAKKEALPQFVIRSRYIKNPKTGYASEDVITIENKGGIVFGLRGANAVFLHIELTPKPEMKGKQHNLLVPLNEYYAATVHSPEGVGELLNWIGYQNNKKAATLERGFEEFANQKGWFGFVQIRRYIRLEYIDLLEEKHIDFYHVPSIYGATRLPSTVGENIFKLHDRGFENGALVDIDRLTPAALFEFVFDKEKAGLLKEESTK